MPALGWGFSSLGELALACVGLSASSPMCRPSARSGSSGRRSSCCREVVGQQSPSAAAADDVEEDGVEDLTGAVHLGTPGSVGERQMRLKEGPHFVREVALGCFSHARHPTERVPQYPFSDSFKAKFAEVRRGWPKSSIAAIVRSVT